MRLRRMMVSIVAFWVVAMLLPTNASAQFRLRIEDLVSGQGVVVTDAVGVTTAGDQNGAQGLISTMLVGLGNVSFSITSGQTKPIGVATTGAVGEMKLTSVTFSTTGPAQLRLTLEDTNYSLPTSPSALLASTQILNLNLGSAPGSTLVSQSWINTDPLSVPALGAEQNTIGPLGAITNLDSIATGHGSGEVSLNSSSTGTIIDGQNVFGSSSGQLFGATGPFSLFTQVVLDIKGPSGQLSFDQVTTAMAYPAELIPPTGDPSPEPGALLLIATGVIGAGSRMRRRFFRG